MSHCLSPRRRAQPSVGPGFVQSILEIGPQRRCIRLVIGCGVYNFGVTGPLKHWIDMVCRVGETFKYTEAGPQGLAGAKRVVVAYASGGVPAGSGYDLATPYLKQVLGFIGITDVEIVAAQGMNVDAAAAMAKADEQIAALAA